MRSGIVVKRDECFIDIVDLTDEDLRDYLNGLNVSELESLVEVLCRHIRQA